LVEVGEEFAVFGAVFGAEDALLFEPVDDPGGALVADAEAALEEGGGGAFFLADGFDAVADEVGVFLGDFGLVVAAGDAPVAWSETA